MWWVRNYPGSKVHEANMGPIWGRQDPSEPHVGPWNIASGYIPHRNGCDYLPSVSVKPCQLTDRQVGELKLPLWCSYVTGDRLTSNLLCHWNIRCLQVRIFIHFTLEPDDAYKCVSMPSVLYLCSFSFSCYVVMMLNIPIVNLSNTLMSTEPNKPRLLYPP